jgi:acyl transferase domain-containing protein
VSARDPLAGLSAEKRALLARRLRQEGDAARILAGDPVAVVGLGCRLPGGVRGPADFWRLLRGGRDAVGPMPPERWAAASVPGAPPRGGFMDQVDAFDAAFFGVPPREAASMDPQQRIFLEVAWEALEDAGQTRAVLAGSRTGVFAGLCIGDFGRLLLAGGEIDAYAVSGTADAMAANRLSYLLDLRGPSVAVDTACSSSLVAVHLACQSLRAGECDLALAGGVNAILAPEVGVALGRWGVLSPGGACRAFDAGADGFVRAEGCGVVVLRRLADALEAGDRVLAVVRGTAVNQDGRSNGLTAPSTPAQEAVVRAALANGGVEPGRVRYVETHGTGTALGDPVELEALARVFGPTSAGEPIYLGAAKSALGHLEAAAGVAGLIKAVLALRHGQIPPNLHFRTPNPAFAWDASPFRVPTSVVAWPPSDPRRCAGVSAMGFGGTNAHVVLEEAPPAAPSASTGGEPLLLALSARSATALERRAAAVRDLLRGADAPAARDLCYTAGARRTHHEERLAVVGATGGELADALDAALAGGGGPRVARGRAAARPGGVAFVFGGQGSAWAGMGRALLDGDAAFREAVEAFDRAFVREAGWSVAAELRRGDAARLARTDVAQPAICAVQIGVVAALAARGVVPHALLGHSVGEIAAAHAAGALPTDGAARVAFHRSRLMHPAAGRGAMAAAALTLADAEALLRDAGDGEVWIAAVNSPASVALAGEPAALERVLATLAARGVWHRRLEVDHAFHTPQLDGAAAQLPAALAGLAASAPRIPLFSTVTGRLAAAGDCGAGYWGRNVRQPVRFAQAVAAALADGCTALVEIGPHPVLQRALLECGDAAGAPAFAIPTLRRGGDGPAAIVSAVARLHVAGHPVDWPALFPGGGAVVDLPAYPWDHVRFPIPRPVRAPASPPAAASPADGRTRDASTVDGRSTARGPDSPDAADGWLYDVAWRPAEERRRDADLGAEGTWIVLADRGGVGAEAARLIEARGGRCLRVAPGDGFARGADGELRAAAANAAGWRRVVDEACAAGAPLRGVLHLWAMDAAPPSSATGVDGDVERACAPALHLAQALAAAPGAAGARLWLATRAAQAADGEAGAAAPAQAPLWGLGRVIALEHPSLFGGMVDLPASPSPADVAALVDAACGGGGHAVLALRGGRAFAPLLVPAAVDPQARVGIRADGTYLVTGGAGALGMATARWLAARGAGALVLLGRRAAPAAAVAELEALGPRVRIAAADVADAAALEAALGAATAGLPPLRGVVHAAGVTGDAALQHLAWEAFRAVLAPRVAGTWNLHQSTAAAAADFRVAFSSMAALYGAPGQGAYAAASAFPHAFAGSVSGWASVAWGPWEGAGMFAALDPATAARRRDEGIGSIAPADGVRLLDRLLGGGRATAAVLPVEWARFAARSPLARTGPLPAGVHAAAAREAEADLAARVAGASAGRRRAVLLACVREETARVLGAAGPAAVDPAAGFTAQGLDSLMMVELRARLQARAGRPLSHTAGFDHPSPAELAAHLDTLLAPAGRMASAETTETMGSVETMGSTETMETTETMGSARSAERPEWEPAPDLAETVDAGTPDAGSSPLHLPVLALHPPELDEAGGDGLEELDEEELERRLAAALAELDAEVAP